MNTRPANWISQRRSSTSTKKALTSTQITAYSTTWVSGATTYTREVSTGVGSEKVTLTYTPYSNAVGSYTYATSSGSGKFTLSQSNTNYSISSAGNFTLTGAAISGSVSISGTATWGQTLTANASCTTPSSGCTFGSYQWYANGSAISGATSSTYTVPKEQVGKTITVSVVASATNYANKTLTSSATAAIAKQDLAVTTTNYNAAYDGSTHYATIKVTSASWDGATIVSGTSTSYGTNVTTSGAVNTSYNLSPGYDDFTNGAKTVYYKVTGGTYYNDKTGSATVNVTKKALTSTQITAYSTTWVSGATTYTREVSTGVGSEKVTLTYTPYTNTIGSYSYATSAASGKFTLSQTNSNYSISSAGDLTLTDSVSPIVQDIAGGTTLKATTQTLTLKCTDNIGVTAYYFGDTNPTSASSITTDTSDDLTALQGSSGLTTNVSAAGTYYLGCKDAAGNIASKSIVIRKYQVQNVLEKIAGTTGTYTSANYENSGSAATYYVKNGTTLTLASIYSSPTEASNSGTFKGYTTSAPGTSAASPSTTAPTVATNNTTVYYMWFDRNTYNVTLTKRTYGNVTGETVTQTGNSVTVLAGASANETLTVKYGDTVKATATPNPGYSFTGWSGDYVSGTTNPVTGGAITSNKTITATFADITPPTGSITTSTGSNTVTATITVSDAGSGPKSSYGWKVSTDSTCDSSTTGFVDSNSNTYNFNITSIGIHYICVRIEDNAGNKNYVSKVAETSYIDYEYTGDYQPFTVPVSGYYKMEAWGAQGGTVLYNGATSDYIGGFGAYTSGYIYLNQNDTLYVYAGGKGGDGLTAKTTALGGYNGGGTGDHDNSDNEVSGGGGGATDIRLVSGTWNDATSLNSRIMVAAGGGGGADVKTGLPGGDLINSATNSQGYTSTLYTATTQNSGYAFGIGQNGARLVTNYPPSGGGGGYYGGISPSSDSNFFLIAGGGSSFISGYAGVNAITSASSRTHTNNTLHYGNKYFIDGEMQTGVNSGNGKAKITYVGDAPERINTNLNNVRYIKDCINGNSTNEVDNHWVELQAIKDGINLAKGITATGIDNVSAHPISYITDGDIDTSKWAWGTTHTGLQCIIVDLGSSYNLDEIAVWHYFKDGRTYYDNVTYTSSDNSTWNEVIKNTDAETSNGKRVSAWNYNVKDIYTITYNDNLFNAYNQTANGVTVTYDATNQYLTLNGTWTNTEISLWNLERRSFTANDKYTIKLTYVSGSYTTTVSPLAVLELTTDGSQFSDRTTSPKSFVNVSLPTSENISSTLTVDSSRTSANGLKYKLWQSTANGTTFTNYKIRVEVTKVHSKRVTYGSTYGTLETPTRTGSRFDGWYTAITGGTKVTNTSTVSITSNQTLYAHWTKYAVYAKYNMNGGSWAGSTNTHLSTSGNFVTYDDSQTFKLSDYGGIINLANYDNDTYINISRTGYTAKSGSQWCTGTTGNGSCYNHNTDYADAGIDSTASTHFCNATSGDCTVTLYVNWIGNTYTINYYQGNGTSTAGSTKIGSSTCTYGSSCTLTTYADLGATFPISSASNTTSSNSYNHYWSFYGWGTSNSDTSRDYTNGQTFTYNTVGNLNLYAIGSKRFYFSSGQKPTSLDSDHTPYQYWNPHRNTSGYMTSITIPSQTSISGWTLLGYGNDQTDATIIYNTSQVGTTITPAYDAARWLRSKYKRTLTIKYNANGGSGTTSNTTATQYYNSGYANNGANVGEKYSYPSFTLAANGFTKTNSMFSKWADGSTSGTQYAAGATYSTWKPKIGDATTKNMYAIWKTGVIIPQAFLYQYAGGACSNGACQQYLGDTITTYTCEYMNSNWYCFPV